MSGQEKARTMTVSDKCRCGHFRDYHKTFFGSCRKDDCRCERFRDVRDAVDQEADQ